MSADECGRPFGRRVRGCTSWMYILQLSQWSNMLATSRRDETRSAHHTHRGTVVDAPTGTSCGIGDARSSVGLPANPQAILVFCMLLPVRISLRVLICVRVPSSCM